MPEKLDIKAGELWWMRNEEMAFVAKINYNNDSCSGCISSSDGWYQWLMTGQSVSDKDHDISRKVTPEEYAAGKMIDPMFSVDQLDIKWECVPPDFDKLTITAQCKMAISRDNFGCQLFEDEAWIEHIAPKWKDHIGETHYRDGRVEWGEG